VIASEGLPIEVACRVLGVSWSGFYAWRCRPPSPRAVRHAWLTDVIREIHAASYGSYGAKRVYAELRLGRGIQVGHNAVAMLMQWAGIAGRNGARKWRGIPGAATAEDLVDPQSPWQRGTNENTNGLLRQYFSKGTDLARWSADEIEAVAAALNSRPRKTLGWRTPAEALNEYLLSSQQASVATTG
jgi:hypothetical protein